MIDGLGRGHMATLDVLPLIGVDERGEECLGGGPDPRHQRAHGNFHVQKTLTKLAVSSKYQAAAKSEVPRADLASTSHRIHGAPSPRTGKCAVSSRLENAMHL